MSMQENQETVPVNGATNGSANGEHRENNTKGNEDRKIFVGGIAYDVQNEDLQAHFSSFGEVVNAQVKFDRNTGRSRGFAFVEFATADVCKQALAKREQTIKGKNVEVKPAKSRENKKVFVGGLPNDFSEEELRQHFEAYGKVEDIEWPFDKTTKMHRNFAFIVFEEEEGADRAATQPRQTFGTRECDVKKAVPQNKRFSAMGRGGMPGMRGGYSNPMRGGAMGMQNPAQWFGNTWGQMGHLYGQGQWGEWYNNGSFYAPQNTPGAANYANGYDYTQAQNANRPQPAANAAAGRYPQY